MKKISDADTVFLCCVVLLFIYITRSSTSLENSFFYSPDIDLQIRSFLQGRLSISDTPFGMLHDWAYANSFGLHQNWGLGVPLLLLPFTLFFKIFGMEMAPGFWVRIFYYTFLLIISFRLLKTAFNNNRFFSWGITGILFLDPAFLSLLKARDSRYEEPVFYLHLWAILSIVVLINYFKARNEKHILRYAVFAGLAALIRPTAVVYSCVGLFLILCDLIVRKKIKTAAVTTALFAGSLGVYLYTNYLRFGNPLAFSYGLAISSFPIIDYSLAIANNFTQNVSFVDRVIETFQLSWTSNFSYIPESFFSRNFGPGISSELRFREFITKIVHPFWVPLFITSGALLVAIFKSKIQVEGGGHKRIFFGTAIFGMVVTTIIFLFYTSTPGFSSRYCVDFAGAINALQIGILIVIWEKYFKQNTDGYKGVIFAIVAYNVLLPLSSRNLFEKYHIYQSTYWETVGRPLSYSEALWNLKKVEKNLEQNAVLPEVVACDGKHVDSGVRYNHVGWAKSCAVDVLTTHFFKYASCIYLNVEFKDPSLKNTADLQEVKVKVGNAYFDQASVTPLTAKVTQLKYCENPQLREQYLIKDPKTIAAYKIAWVPVAKVSEGNPPLKLMLIARLNSP